MTPIEAGTIVYKSATLNRNCACAVLNCAYKPRAIITLRVTKPGFIADYDDNTVYNYDQKGRVREAEVLAIEPHPYDVAGGFITHSGPIDVACSFYDHSFVYRVGKIVRPTRGFSEENVACAPGIHCFLDKHDAEIY